MSEKPNPEGKFVWNVADIDSSNGALFGGKAAGLGRMMAAGIPVPPAFVISTAGFRAFHANRQSLPDGLDGQVDEAIARICADTGRQFGAAQDGRSPLLVSVRSGAQVSMPGMMDTVLNLGLDAASARAMIERGAKPAFVLDTWLRFWKMYAEIVLGLEGQELVDAIAARRSTVESREFEVADLAELEAVVVSWIEGETGERPPTDPREQLDQTISAVFSSWESSRAKAYRDHHGIAHDLGTAVTVQAMVFGNVDAKSGSGVAFSRNPNTGEARLYGEYLAGRQGEDVVSGAATPVDLSKPGEGHVELSAALDRHARELEQIYDDAVDIEFTVESGKLYFLQVRSAKRTAAAAVNIAADLIEEGLVSPQIGLQRVTDEQIRRLLRPVFDPDQLQNADQIAAGIGSSPGQASGVAVLDSDRAAEAAAQGDRVILVRPTTSPLDIRGMLAADGILTAKGGALSHAAVVSRALDKPCVVGCGDLEFVQGAENTFRIGDKTFSEGDTLAIDGATGLVYGHGLDLVSPSAGEHRLGELLAAADKASDADIWASPQSRIEMEGLADDDGLPGLGVVALSDIASAYQLSGQLIDCVRTLGHGDGAETSEELASVAKAIALRLFESAPSRPFHIRLPRLASERARSVVPGWTNLDPKLFLAFGEASFYRALLNGLAEAAIVARATVTALLPGATGLEEWARFKHEIAALPGLRGGVAVQNMACLAAAGELLDDGAVVWVDLDEVIDSSHGLVARSHLADAVVSEYFSEALRAENPRAVLKPFLAMPIRALAEKYGRRVGVSFGPGNPLTLVKTVYDLGVRTFGVTPGQREIVRLSLGRAAPASEAPVDVVRVKRVATV